MAQSSTPPIQTQLDRILYLASLVSDNTKIDDHLNPLRTLTATNPQLTRPLTDKERRTLNQIERGITKYLIHDETVRTFTAEELEQRIYERLEAPKRIHQLKLQGVGLIALALVAGFFVSLWAAKSDMKFYVATLTAITTVYLSATAWIIGSLNHQFSPAFRQAWYVLSLGFLLTCLELSAVVALTLVYQSTPPWHIYWPVSIVLYVSYTMQYLALRLLGKLYNISRWRINPWGLVATWLAGAIPLLLMGQGLVIEPFNGYFGLASWFCFSLFIWDMWIAQGLWLRSTDLYKRPFRAFFWAAAATPLGFLLTTVVTMSPPTATGQLLTSLAGLCFLGATIWLFISAYELNKISRQ
jgi:hypothetical protein